MNECFAARATRSDAERRVAQHSAAQRSTAARARLRRSARTYTCAVRAGVPSCLESSPRTALPFVPAAWRFFFVPTAPGGSLWPVLGFFLVRWPLAFPCVMACAAGNGCFSSVLLLSPGGPVGVRGRFLDGRSFQAPFYGNPTEVVQLTESSLLLSAANCRLPMATLVWVVLQFFLELAHRFLILPSSVEREKHLWGGCRRVPGWTLVGFNSCFRGSHDLPWFFGISRCD